MANSNTQRQQKLRKTKKPIRIWNDPTRHAIISREAKRLKMHNSEFVNMCVEEHLKKCILSYDRDMLVRLEFQIRKIGNNTNQLTHLAHIRGAVNPNDLGNVQEHINQVEELIRDAFMHPPELGEMLREALMQHPNFREIVLNILDETP